MLRAFLFFAIISRCQAASDQELNAVGVPTYGNEKYQTEAEGDQRRQEPGFGTIEVAEAAMDDLMALVEGNKGKIDAAVRSVDKPGMSREGFQEASIKVILPLLADLTDPLIRKYKLHRDKEPRKGANFIVFMTAFDKWGNKKDGKHSEAISERLNKFNDMISPKSKSLADEL